jgi:hypothetical protein
MYTALVATRKVTRTTSDNANLAVERSILIKNPPKNLVTIGTPTREASSSASYEKILVSFFFSLLNFD